MVFNVPAAKEKEKNGEHLPADITLEEYRKWKCLYVTYFNKSLSLADGRRANKELCVDDPNVHMIQFACEMLGLRTIEEEVSRHPRDYFGVGRVRVELLKDGKAVKADITNKRQLYAAVASKIPEAQAKFDKMLAEQKAVIEKRNAEMQAKMKEQEAAKEGASAAAGGDGAAKKKKNKKKK